MSKQPAQVECEGSEKQVQEQNGPDNIENMLCLCPNHHDQLDKYSYSINPLDYSIIGLKEFQNQKLFKEKKHKLNNLFLEYHYQYFLKVNKKTT